MYMLYICKRHGYWLPKDIPFLLVNTLPDNIFAATYVLSTPTQYEGTYYTLKLCTS